MYVPVFESKICYLKCDPHIAKGIQSTSIANNTINSANNIGREKIARLTTGKKLNIVATTTTNEPSPNIQTANWATKLYEPSGFTFKASPMNRLPISNRQKNIITITPIIFDRILFSRLNGVGILGRFFILLLLRRSKNIKKTRMAITINKPGITGVRTFIISRLVI